MVNKQTQSKEIDVNQVVEFLSRSFEENSRGLGPRSKAVKGTRLYHYQVEFSYLVDEIQRGPSYILPMTIQQANALIEEMKAESEKVEAVDG